MNPRKKNLFLQEKRRNEEKKHLYSTSQGSTALVQVTRASPCPNQSAVSRSPFSGESLPWMTFLPVTMAWSPLIVPGSAASGLVAPISLRAEATTPAPSQTMATTGPEQMYETRSPKNGLEERSL